MFIIFPNLSIFPLHPDLNKTGWRFFRTGFGFLVKVTNREACFAAGKKSLMVSERGRGELKSGIVEIFTNYAIFMCVFSIALILDVSTVCSAGVSLTCCVCARLVASMFVFCVFARLCQSCGSRLNRKLVAKRKHDDTQWEKISTEIVSDELQTSPVTQFLEEIFYVEIKNPHLPDKSWVIGQHL